MFKTGDLVRLVKLTEDDTLNGRRKYEIGKLIAFDATDNTFLVRFGYLDYYVYPEQIEIADSLTPIELYNWLTNPETDIPFKEQLAKLAQAAAAQEQAKAFDIEPEVCDCYESSEDVKRIYRGALNGMCNGTKERELCGCGGDRSKCDFYKEE